MTIGVISVLPTLLVIVLGTAEQILDGMPWTAAWALVCLAGLFISRRHRPKPSWATHFATRRAMRLQECAARTDSDDTGRRQELQADVYRLETNLQRYHAWLAATGEKE